MTAADFKLAVLNLRLDPEDFEESFSHSGGPGGQNVNKVETAVILLHRPTGVSVRVEDSRSQAKNRGLARERILEQITQARRQDELAKRNAREKKRRQESKRPRGVKERILETKRRRSMTKKARRGTFD